MVFIHSARMGMRAVNLLHTMYNLELLQSRNFPLCYWFSGDTAVPLLFLEHTYVSFPHCNCRMYKLSWACWKVYGSVHLVIENIILRYRKLHLCVCVLILIYGVMWRAYLSWALFVCACTLVKQKKWAKNLLEARLTWGEHCTWHTCLLMIDAAEQK